MPTAVVQEERQALTARHAFSRRPYAMARGDAPKCTSCTSSNSKILCSSLASLDGRHTCRHRLAACRKCQSTVLVTASQPGCRQSAWMRSHTSILLTSHDGAADTDATLPAEHSGGSFLLMAVWRCCIAAVIPADIRTWWQCPSVAVGRS